MYHLIDPILARCTSDVALALRQPLVASVGVDVISAPIDESIDVSVDYAHLECEQFDQSISAALKDARLQYINCLSMDRKMRFLNASIDTILAKRQVLVCQQKMDELRAKVPSFIMDIFAKHAPGEDEPKLMGEYDSANNCAAAIAHFGHARVAVRLLVVRTVVVESRDV
jgi:hypothetical protein